MQWPPIDTRGGRWSLGGYSEIVSHVNKLLAYIDLLDRASAEHMATKATERKAVSSLRLFLDALPL